jgi:S-adenosylmethionine:tRNA ribosyltransferase-isomerase
MVQPWFDLPAERIARRPAARRDGGLLLQWAPDGVLIDRRVVDLPSLLEPGDLLVVNNARVVPARVFGERPGGGRAELLFVQPEPGADDRRWIAWGKPAKRLVNRRVTTPGGALIVHERSGDGALLVGREDGGPLTPWLDAHGAMPLPPYMDRPADAADREDYQTVYASRPGAVAAPTAGLHLSADLLAKFDAMGVAHAEVTLHVGPGTFQPIRVDDPADHELVPEFSVVPEATCAAIAACKAGGGRVVAVGTTVVRSLERAAQKGAGTVVPLAEFNGLYIWPGGHEFQVVDALLTNFHLPDSSLIQLVAAFAGEARTRAAYAHALAGAYRFYSYGDANFVLPEAPVVLPQSLPGGD